MFLDKQFSDIGAWGKGMYALGYDWKYVFFRIIRTSFLSPKGGVSMFWNWITHEDVEKMAVADWVNRNKKKLFWTKLFNNI